MRTHLIIYPITSLLVFLTSVVLISTARASDYDIDMNDIDIPEIEIADWQVAGDGKTPTFLQYLDIKGYEAKEARHLISATAKGDSTYALDIPLPPALLKPVLTLAYSSAGGMNKEISFGWELKGIAEIRRPLERAFEKRVDESWQGEWLASAPGFSGTLKMSGNEDYRYLLRTSNAAYVIADYNKTANSWQLRQAGQKENVIPSRASVTVDGRFLPGHTVDGFLNEVKAFIGPGFDIEVLTSAEALEMQDFDNPFYAAIKKSLMRLDPGCVPVPFLIPGYTDAKNYAKLGIKCYGFAPTKLPADLNFGQMYHGHNERIPVDAIGFGVRALWDVVVESCG